ncbi:MAG: tetratricopeptide repeat protein [Candidatus Eisenbacteria bacterium]|nr:tetratricopeptide repeat protein [Candidatus Eisenbacteria bacterium]
MQRTYVLALVVVMVALLALSGCVYYNTFYHAREAAGEAAAIRESRAPDTDPTARERELYERVVEKSGRVLALHPESSWADDALLLMAQALAYQGRYESAGEHLNEFLSLYADSELRSEADYTLGSVLIELGNPVTAEELLIGVAYADPPVELSDDALLLVGDARAARRRREEAAEAYLEALDRFPDSDRRAQTLFPAAENYAEMGRFEQAADLYVRVPEETSSRTLAFEARLRLSEVLLSLDRAGDALDVALDLEGRTVDRTELDRVELQSGLALEALGDYEEAIETYEEIAASHARSEGASKAYYRIGVVKRDALGDLDGAVEAFRSSSSAYGRGETAELASQAAEDILRLKEYRRIIEDYESRPEEERAPASTAPPDTSSAAADTLEIAPASDDTSSARPAQASVPDDEAAAAPDTSGANGGAAAADSIGRGSSARERDAAGARSDTTELSPEEEAARARFLLAELQLFRFDDPTRALELYREVLELHPDSAHAPRAALAVAWVLEKRLEDLEAASDAYERVIESYPGTDRAEAAEKALARLASGS